MVNKRWLGFVLVVAMLMASVLAACTAPASTGGAPAKEAAPVKAAAPVKEAAPAKEAAPVKEASPAKEAAPAKEVIQLTYAALYPEQNFYSKAGRSWADKIEKETGGRVKFKFFYAGSLYTPPNWFQEIKKGTADIGEGLAAYVPQGFELHRALNQQMYDVGDWKTSIRIYNELATAFPQLPAEMADVKVLAVRGALDDTQVISKKRVASLKDLKGLRLRGPADFVPWLKELGAEPLTMSVGETYQAMEKGIIDGTVMPYEALKGFKFAEVAKYVTLVNYGAFPGPVLYANMATWNKLPPDIQKVFMDNSEYETEMIDKFMREDDEGGKAYGKEQGVEYIQLPKEDLNEFYRVVGAASAKTAGPADAKGLPGTKMVEMERGLIAKYKK